MTSRLPLLISAAPSGVGGGDVGGTAGATQSPPAAAYPGQGSHARLLDTPSSPAGAALGPTSDPRCLPLAQGRRVGSHEHPLGADGGP